MDLNLFEKLLYENEDPALDFKRDQYRFIRATDDEKSELLKDILSFANAWRRTDAYILIGVQEVKEGKSIVIGTTEHLEEANLQQFVNSKTNKPINFSYEVFVSDQKQVDVIQIPVQERPFFLLHDFGKLSKDKVYIRRGSSTDTADPDEIAKMGAAIFETKQTPNLSFQFGEKSSRTIMGSKLVLMSEVLLLPEKSEIPTIGRDLASIAEMINSSYYREFADYLFYTSLFRPIGFVVFNNGETVARNVKVQFSQPKLDQFFISDSSGYPHKPQYSGIALPAVRGIKSVFDKTGVDVEDRDDKWEVSVEVGSIQPGAQAWSDVFYIGASTPYDLNLMATVYADNLPRPFQVNLEISIVPKKRSVSLDELIEAANASNEE